MKSRMGGARRFFMDKRAAAEAPDFANVKWLMARDGRKEGRLRSTLQSHGVHSGRSAEQQTQAVQRTFSPELIGF